MNICYRSLAAVATDLLLASAAMAYATGDHLEAFASATRRWIW